MSLVIIQFDRLPASSLGCYGSFACDTPAFDLLAAQGITFDGCFVSDPDLNVRSCMPADRPLLELELDAGSPGAAEASAAIVGNTIDRIGDAPIWCNVSLADFGEFENSDFGSGPEIDERLERHFESVTLAEEFLMQAIQFIAGYDETIGVIVTASRGDRLAARTVRPEGVLPIGEEVAHIPLIVALSDGPIGRRDDLLGTIEIGSLLSGLAHVPNDSKSAYLENWLSTVEGRDVITYGATPWQAVRTNEWLAVRRIDGAHLASDDPVEDWGIQLFAKPDDRWEVLDLSRQYPAVVEDLAAKAGWTDRR